MHRFIWVLLFFLGLVIVGCEEKSEKESSGESTKWPAGSGYQAKPKNRPVTPHGVEPTSGNVIITGVAGDRFLMQGDLEIREGKMVTIFPGKTITHGFKSKTKLEIDDYNGDKCVLLYGMTVKVDEYGQYAFVKYAPADVEVSTKPEPVKKGLLQNLTEKAFGRAVPPTPESSEAASGNTNWQKNFDRFLDKFGNYAKKKTNISTPKSISDMYVKKDVQWKLKFKQVTKDQRGDKIEFDLEPHGILKKTFSSKYPVWISFAPAANSLADWKNQKAGSTVTFNATIDNLFFFEMGGKVFGLVQVKNLTVTNNN